MLPYALPTLPGAVSDDGRVEDEVRCSARGCRSGARHVLVWNNPKIHTPDREKRWVACAEHRVSLSDYLAARGLLRRVDPLPPGPQPAVPPPEGHQPQDPQPQARPPA